jgi:hypothetical protein
MRTLKKFAVLAVAVFAVSVVGVASASAAQFTASAAGSIEGAANGNQVFTNGSLGTVTCTAAKTTGSAATAATAQKVNVEYTGCTAAIPLIGNKPVNTIKAEYNLLASGSVEILNEIEITVPALSCTTKVTKGQTVGSVAYSNIASNTQIEEKSTVTGIHSTSTGLCPSGTSGTYTGNNIVHRVGGGTVSFDA